MSARRAAVRGRLVHHDHDPRLDHAPPTAVLIIVFGLTYPIAAVLILATHDVIPGGGIVDRLPISSDELFGLLLTVGALLPATVYVTWAGRRARGRPAVAWSIKPALLYRHLAPRLADPVTAAGTAPERS
jgi:hypothetical protein